MVSLEIQEKQRLRQEDAVENPNESCLRSKAPLPDYVDTSELPGQAILRIEMKNGDLHQAGKVPIVARYYLFDCSHQLDMIRSDEKGVVRSKTKLCPFWLTPALPLMPN